ncbi:MULTISPECIES: hypothetical protein [unclassified Streptomyces]|uniref:hypothetical protein n=1 Tax=unclassified Streptomyces TaxID=2593676 RepID=UPI000DC29D11|nr:MULTISPECIES: hypothetical protein [unclassified Streptomyces]MYT73165.1 hypothetical protein [Streptomyces sp. SID8367]RAJ73626.1 hypothetical protein K377_07055 [Streptomyces sp. PsTaAH-137]
MGRHASPARTFHAPTVQARRRLTAGLTSASALVAACLALTVDPAAPAAPDRAAPRSGTSTSEKPQLSTHSWTTHVSRP